MRNLKRALSLALASVMVLGMMVVGSSASYKDVDDSYNQEAIEVLQAVKIMVGDDNGNFNPDAKVTRNEMAVIMSNLLNLDYDYYRGINPFTDVPEWAAPYVAACAAEGVTSGIGNGLYGGDQTVTASQAALMVMKALGYFQYNEDFGDDWQVSTIRQASYISLFDNINANAETALTRNQVAQLVLNGLKADMVTFTGDVGSQINLNGNQINIGYRAEYTERTNAAKKYNTIAGQKTDIAGNNQYYVQLGEELYNGDLKLSTDTDVFGRPARVWEYDGKEIGTYLNYDLLVKEYTVKVTGKDLYDLLGSSTIKDYDLTVVIDGVDDAKIDSNIFTAADMNKNNTQGVGATEKGVLTQVFVNNDSKAIIITEINTYLAIADKDYDAKKDELAITVYGVDEQNGEYIKTKTDNEDKSKFTLDGEDFDIADLVEDDALLVTIADGEVQTIAEPTILSEVEISAFKKDSNVTVDGTKYEYSSAAEFKFGDLNAYTSSTNNVTNLKDATYNVYLDKYGYAIGVEEIDPADNYLFITGIDLKNSSLGNKTAEAAAIFLDGTMEVINVNMTKSTLDVSGATALINSWCTYTVNKDGVYTVTEVADATTNGNNIPGGSGNTGKIAQYHETFAGTGTVDIDKKNISLTGRPGTGSFSRVYGNDSTVYLTAELAEIIDNTTNYGIIDDVSSVTTGVKNANLKVWESSLALTKAEDSKVIGAVTATTISEGVYTLYKNNGYIIAAVVVGDDGAAAKNLVYVTSSDVEQESYDTTTGEWTWTRKVFYQGEEILLTEVSDSSTYLESMVRYNWYQVKLNANGEVIGVESDPNWDIDIYVTSSLLVPNAVKSYDTVLYEEGVLNNKPTMSGSTLYAKTTDDSGFFVAEDVNIALIQYNRNTVKTTFETGADELEDIIDTLNKDHDNNNFNYTISAIIEDGAATTVVIKDDSNPYEPTKVNKDVEVIVNDSTGAITVEYYGDKNEPTTSEAIALIEAELEAQGYTISHRSYTTATQTYSWSLIDANGFSVSSSYTFAPSSGIIQLFKVTLELDGRVKTLAAAGTIDVELQEAYVSASDSIKIDLTHNTSAFNASFTATGSATGGLTTTGSATGDGSSKTITITISCSGIDDDVTVKVTA